MVPAAIVRSRTEGTYIGAVVLDVACPHGRHGHTVVLLDGLTEAGAWCGYTAREYHVTDPEHTP